MVLRRRLSGREEPDRRRAVLPQDRECVVVERPDGRVAGDEARADAEAAEGIGGVRPQQPTAFREVGVEVFEVLRTGCEIDGAGVDPYARE